LDGDADAREQRLLLVLGGESICCLAWLESGIAVRPNRGSRRGQMDRQLILVVFAVGAFSQTAAAHHSRAAYDMTQEIVIEGTVADLQWRNPHIFMTVETQSPGGEAYRLEIEVTSVSEAPVLGLTKEAIAPGSRLVVRAHPGRAGPRARAVGLSATTRDGTVYPLNTDARLAIRTAAAVQASGIAGRWAPTLESFNGVMAAARSWPLTAAGRAAGAEAASKFEQADVAVLGICEPFPPPLLSIFPDVRTIDVKRETATLRFEGGVGLSMERVVHLDQAEHPDDVVPTLMGHSIGRWEGETLVIDTIAFSPHRVGTMFFPSGPSKHLIERLTLAPDRLRLEYVFTVEDPGVLAEPVSYTAIWDHRPDLQLSGEACDPEVARRPLR
jgi:hypothetical protein